jgi:hypothetical protein
MSIERKKRGEQKIPRKYVSPEVKTKYRLAQRYLINHVLPIENPRVNVNDVRHYYVALVQSIAGEGMLGIPHSPETHAALDHFLTFFRRAVREIIILHIDSWKVVEAQKAGTFIPEFSEFPHPGTQYYLRHWDELYDLIRSSMRGVHKLREQWFAIERMLDDYTTQGHYTKQGVKSTDPIWLFEKIRDVSHHDGFVLAEFMFSFEIPHEGSVTDWYTGFMDQLSWDAFAIDIPYRFGYDGKHKGGVE